MSKWQPMRTAPKDGTVILLCELLPGCDEGNVMPGCWMRANGDPLTDDFWAVAPTSHVPVHLLHKYENREGMAVGWKPIALTPVCWMPMPESPPYDSLRRRLTRVLNKKYPKLIQEQQ